MSEEIDFDFFDDPAEQGPSQQFMKDIIRMSTPENQESSHQNSSSHSSSDSDDNHVNLHGTSSTNGDVCVSSKSSDQHDSSDESSSDDTIYSDSEPHGGLSSTDSSLSDQSKGDYIKSSKSEERRTKINVNTKRKAKSSRRPIGDGDSSDSVTDVSPLSSPDRSPNLNHRGVKQMSGARHDPSSPGPGHSPPSYRHITKLNVTFNTQKQQDAQVKRNSNHTKSSSRPRNPKLKNNASYDWSSDSEDGDDEYAEYPDDARFAYTSALRQRQDKAHVHHRQRLLDSAARGSMDISSLLETVLEFEKQNQDRTARSRHEQPINYRIGERMLNSPGKKQRKNMSFTNDQVREIDRENQRLMRQITNRSRPSSAASVRSNVSSRSSVSTSSRYSSKSASSRASNGRRRSNDKPVKLYHTALNRIQYQRQIERENMQLLKRLQAAKSTPGLRRQKQLADHKRQANYMGTTIDRSGMSIRKAQELTRNAEVVQEAIGLKINKQPTKAAWQDAW